MKRKNYALKFGLTIITIVIPIITFTYALLIILLKTNIINMLITYGVAIAVVFVVATLTGYGLYRFGNVTINKENSIENQRGIIFRKKDIRYISCYRFIFVYSINFHTSPFTLFSSLSLYFYNKKEMIDFIKENDFLKEYIREKDKIKLGLGDEVNE